MRRLLLLLASTTVLVATVSAPASAGIWTPVETGLASGDTITAIDYPSASVMTLGTSTGKIVTRGAGGTFTVAKPGSSTTIQDIAFKPGSALMGLAVGTNGNIWRTTNGGTSWAQISFTDFEETKDCGSDQNNPPGGHLPQVTNPTYSLNSVAWGPSNRVFVVGSKSTVLRSNNDGASFTEINKSEITEPGFPTYKQIACQQQGYYDTVVPLPAAASTADNAIPVYFYAGTYVYYSSTGLTSVPAKRANLGSFKPGGHLAIDLTQPSHQWAANLNSGSDLYYTDDDASYHGFDIVNKGSNTLNVSTNIAAAGEPQPTVFSTGKGGEILQSVDGEHFYYNKADGALNTTDWYAVAGFDKGNFAVGGQGGKLVVTTQGATVPDIVAPTGTISGPTSVVAGTSATYTANLADEAGGSGVNPASISWSAPGLPGATGNPATFTFPSAGSYSLKVAFADNAGNPGSATFSVTATAPKKPDGGGGGGGGTGGGTITTTTTKKTVAGAEATVVVPTGCVPTNSTFSTSVNFKRKGKTSSFLKATQVVFTVDGKKVATVKKAPFTVKVSTSGLKSGAHTLKSKATIKLKGKMGKGKKAKKGKTTTTSLTSPFTVC